MSYTQTFLPIIKSDTKRVLGLYSIASTVFVGTETTFALAEGSVPVGLFTPEPSIIRRQSGPFMAALPTHIDIVQQAYKGYGQYIPVESVAPANNWSVTPGAGAQLQTFDGALLYGLKYNLGTAVTLPTVGAPTVTTPAALTWDASAPFANAPTYKYFDFNWVNLFAVSFPTLTPAFIQVTTNPAGLSAVVIMNEQEALQGVTYNTVRIIKTGAGALATGAYAFVFNIVDRQGHNTAVTLNLTVV